MKGKSKRAARNNKEWRNKNRQMVLQGYCLDSTGKWVSERNNVNGTTLRSMRAGYGMRV